MTVNRDGEDRLPKTPVACFKSIFPIRICWVKATRRRGRDRIYTLRHVLAHLLESLRVNDTEMDYDTSSNLDDQDYGHDSDAIDTDVEEQLYAQIYHQDMADHSSPSTLKPRDDQFDAGHGNHTQLERNANSIMVSYGTEEVITIGSDSDEDNQCSKSMIARRTSKPADLQSNSSDSGSDSSLLDISSNSDLNSENSTTESVFRLNNHVIGDQMDAAAKVVNFDDEEDDDDDFQVFEDEVRVKKLTTSSVLKSFLGKCKPSYSPPSCGKSSGQRIRKERKRIDGNIKEVTLDLLNSLPGSSNRFKRMRLDPGESPDLWKLDIEDVQSNSKKRSAKARYYRQHRCNHCRDFTSHTTDRCPFPKPEPVCSVCGNEGHIDVYCQDIFCSKCCRKGHLSQSCSFNFKTVHCNTCSLFGHLDDNCPNHWRKYHSTTLFGDYQVKKMTRNVSRIWCGNCGRRGHFAHECHQLYSSKLFWPTSPFLEPSTAMFNIVHDSKSNRRKPGGEITTPSSVRTKKKFPDTPAAIDALSNLFGTSKPSKRGKKVKNKTPYRHTGSNPSSGSKKATSKSPSNNSNNEKKRGKSKNKSLRGISTINNGKRKASQAISEQRASTSCKKKKKTSKR